MTALGWVLVSLAFVVLPATGARPSDPEPERTNTRAPQSPQRDRMLLAVAVAAVAAGCVAAGGVPAGVMLASIAAPLAGVALRYLQRRPNEPPADRCLALTLDLAAAALRAGRPLADALTAAAPAAHPATAGALERVAGLLRLGAEPAQAWSTLSRDGPLAQVAVVALRSATSGLRLAASFERLAAQIRAETSAAASARAHRAGITAMAPLGACFLPSFVCLGVVPVVVGIARAAFGGLP